MSPPLLYRLEYDKVYGGVVTSCSCLCLFEHTGMHVPPTTSQLWMTETATGMANWEDVLSTIEVKHGRESGIYKDCLDAYES